MLGYWQDRGFQKKLTCHILNSATMGRTVNLQNMIKNRIDSLTFLHSGHFPDCQSVIDRSFPDYMTIQFAESGRIHLGYDAHVREQNAPLIWFTAPGPRIQYYGIGAQKWNHHYLAIRGPLVDSWARAGLLPMQGVPVSPDALPELRRELTDIRREVTLARSFDKLAKINRLENLLIKIQRWTTQKSGKKHCPIAKMIESTLKAEAFSNIDYSALADVLDISLSTLRRRFRQRHGESVHRYVQRLRIERVKQCMINDAERPLADIAAACGYCDEYYLSRHFKQEVGLSPSAFRRSLP